MPTTQMIADVAYRIAKREVSIGLMDSENQSDRVTLALLAWESIEIDGTSIRTVTADVAKKFRDAPLVNAKGKEVKAPGKDMLATRYALAGYVLSRDVEGRAFYPALAEAIGAVIDAESVAFTGERKGFIRTVCKDAPTVKDAVSALKAAVDPKTPKTTAEKADALLDAIVKNLEKLLDLKIDVSGDDRLGTAENLLHGLRKK